MICRERIIEEDMQRIIMDDAIPWELLRKKTVFITGATGLIGQTIVRAFLFQNRFYDMQVRVLALVRDEEKARSLFRVEKESAPKELVLVPGSLEYFPNIPDRIDYVIHCACPTESQLFTKKPVDTVWSILDGTKKVLDLAFEKKTINTVFLSSMEVYGTISVEKPLKETDLGELDICSPRSSYPMAKRMAENLCYGYSVQYGLNVSICRLAQTFGPGVRYKDGRVFAYMMRCANTGKNIQLNTSGAKKNMYVYTADATAAIIMLLLKGKCREIYNVGNPSTYCSIKEMGELVASTIGNGKISVETNVGEQNGLYPPDGFLKLDVSKIYELGWKPRVDLAQMYRRMLISTSTSVGEQHDEMGIALQQGAV